MNTKISGKEVSSYIKNRILDEVKHLTDKPCLAVVLVGNNPASLSYVSSKKKSCEELGFNHRDIELEESVSEEALLLVIDELNNDKDVDGILVQLPLPKHIDTDNIIRRIVPEKDVDGFTPVNMGNLVLGQDCFVPCTPKGILALLDYYKIDTDGKKVVVVGRSNIVGKPIANLLMQKDRNATVTVCNTHTVDLKKECLAADILIVACGQREAIKGDMVKEGAVVIDVGINRIEDSTRERGWRLVGDCDYNALKDKVSAITPVPGGVGPMTIAMLMENTLIAFKRRRGL
ncbi:MAG: bifunctional 5,10-methylenetetrahydrofolate dehydrogenase/5,10-methenyltetrahydrofolate cyclohydrolase [Sphaerochaetaceae bacterium]|nr:bifunctional 5,10-methylenetetrahydrofolate dehydrogenase/5,10-methenyltetrahydrofolate cyclohydrolase [Sphaerochaetaceae bacterium]